MTVRVQFEHLDPWGELARFDQSRPGDRVTQAGGLAVFVGSMRDFNEGSTVTAMTLEHYPGMTERYLEKIRDEASQRWQLVDSLIVHRVGPIQPGESIVLVACWAAHRDEAFAACRYLIDELKNRAPFWKQEQTPNGPRWVEGNRA